MGFTGHVVVEVSTRKLSDAEREADIDEALTFARAYLTS
jgi:sugar phosphate isomerase/epimerase